jgi:Ser/Thr protein kinase RdoA (MazF antagonist)
MKRVPAVTEEEALRIARIWDPAAHRVAHVRSGENSTWAIELDNRRSILRLTSEQHRTREQIEAELDFVEHLAGGGLVVARPLTSSLGERVVELPRVAREKGRSWGAMFERLEGRHYEYYSSDIDRPLFLRWGETMGRLHELSCRFAAREGWRRPQWWEDSVAGCDLSGVPSDDNSLGLREQLMDWLLRFQPESSHYGLVHGDFERTNFLILDGTIGLFDFDDACYHWFAWDIACALWVFRNATPGERSRFLGWFLEGYSAVREPDAERLDGFTELVRLRTVALVLHRLRNPERFASEAEWIERTRTWLYSSWTW